MVAAGRNLRVHASVYNLKTGVRHTTEDLTPQRLHHSMLEALKLRLQWPILYM